MEAEDGTSGQFARLVLTGDRAVIGFRRALDCSCPDAWRALSDPDRLAWWFPARIEGDLRPGGPLRFHERASGGEGGNGRVLALVEPELIGMFWGNSILSIELEADGRDRCLLSLSWLTDSAARAEREIAVWHTAVDALACACAGHAPAWPWPARLGELRAVYSERLNPQTAAIDKPHAPPPEPPRERDSPGPKPGH